MRKSERKTLGWLLLSGGTVRFVPRLIVAESWYAGDAAQYGGSATQWQIVRSGGGGAWAQRQESVLEDTGYVTRLLTPDGIVASNPAAQIIHADSTGARLIVPPAIVANNFARAFPIPGLGAIVVPVDDGGAARYGTVYASFDSGVTWRGPIKAFTASPSLPLQQDNVRDYKLLPLYPS